MAPSPKAKCSHCSTLRPQSRLKAAPNGGAICTDWFACQQRYDEKAAAFKAKLART